jgi:hypothetical protein
MQVWEFEQAVFEREEVRIVVRAPSDALVGDYGYKRCASGTSSIAEWLRQRVYGSTGSYDVAVIDGNGNLNPHGRTKLAKLRDTYAD